MSKRIAYRGNFLPNIVKEGRIPWSTEAHVAGSLEILGHTVIRLQEDEVPWADTVTVCRDEGIDLFLWTSTWGYAHIWDQRQAWHAVERLNEMLPTAAFHLDKFFDLPREDQITTEPWFRLKTVATADGGNQDRFAEHNINHIWSPPAVYEPECVIGQSQPRYQSSIAFVGNWHGGYHPEWKHRQQLIQFLRGTYGRKVKFWPVRGQIRGLELSDLYASAQIIVGDSCLVGNRGSYSSDRLPETLGRGGFLIHPRVRGVTDGSLYTEDKHLACWGLGDWKELRSKIAYYLAHPADRTEIAQAGYARVKAKHTYTVRMKSLLDVIFGQPDEIVEGVTA